MEIIVEGVGEKKFKPDMIKLAYTFNVKRKNYEECLSDGSSIVEKYMEFLIEKGFCKEEIKTDRFNIHRESVYNEITRKYDDGDFVFSFSFDLKFDYDLERMSKIVDETSKLEEYPTYRIEFCLKDEKMAVNELMTMAFKNAEDQAKVIADASGKTLKTCQKVSFKPFDDVMSCEYENVRACAKMSRGDFASRNTIQNIFVPKDIELNFRLYTIWIAE